MHEHKLSDSDCSQGSIVRWQVVLRGVFCRLRSEPDRKTRTIYTPTRCDAQFEWKMRITRDPISVCVARALRALALRGVRTAFGRSLRRRASCVEPGRVDFVLIPSSQVPATKHRPAQRRLAAIAPGCGPQARSFLRRSGAHLSARSHQRYQTCRQ